MKVCEFDVPSGTPPKLALDGTTEIWAVTPVAASEIFVAAGRPRPEIVIFPVSDPAICGANVTVNVAVSSGRSERGVEIPLKAK